MDEFMKIQERLLQEQIGFLRGCEIGKKLNGAGVVAPIKKMARIATILIAHHERYDGTGYPNGLKMTRFPSMPVS
jgi:response regulator RpfG family c-di-GMP phosphodiesterase